MATKKELEKRVDELEAINDSLLIDLDWEKLAGQKLMAAMALSNKKNKKSKRGTQLAKKQGTAKGNGHVKASIPVDEFGQRMDTLGARMNAPIIALIHRGRYSRIEPITLSAMVGGQVSSERFKAHLGWLKRKGLL